MLERHHHVVKTMRPDVRLPGKSGGELLDLKYKRNNSKPEQLKRERKMEIRKENSLLLTKINDLSSTVIKHIQSQHNSPVMNQTLHEPIRKA